MHYLRKGKYILITIFMYTEQSKVNLIYNDMLIYIIKHSIYYIILI